MNVLLTLGCIAIAVTLLVSGIVYMRVRRRRAMEASGNSASKVMSDAQVLQYLESMIKSAPPNLIKPMQESIAKLSVEGRKDLVVTLMDMKKSETSSPQLFSSRSPESRPSGARLSGGRL